MSICPARRPRRPNACTFKVLNRRLWYWSITHVLRGMMEDSIRAYSTADLTVGTVVSEKPLKVKVREYMESSTGRGFPSS